MTTTMSVRDASAIHASALARQIDDQGFAVIHEYVGREDLDDAQAFVRKNVEAPATTTLCFQGPSNWTERSCATWASRKFL